MSLRPVSPCGTEVFLHQRSGQALSSFEALYTNSIHSRRRRPQSQLERQRTGSERQRPDDHPRLRAETLSAGTLSFSLAYSHRDHPGRRRRRRRLSSSGANFGNETIDGFAASGTGADTIQLATSSFSYPEREHDPGSGSRAVLNPLNGSSRRAEEHDHHRLCRRPLTLNGLTPSTISANALAVPFRLTRGANILTREGAIWSGGLRRRRDLSSRCRTCLLLDVHAAGKIRAVEVTASEFWST